MSFPPPKKPVKPGARPAGPAPRDSKGEEDGIPDQYGTPASSGYSSEGDDPPSDYYHGQWREHDRPRNANSHERKRQRDKAESWPRSEIGARAPDFYTREDQHRYHQPDEICMVTCAAYFYLRHVDRKTPAQCIEFLKQPWFNIQLPALQKEYEETGSVSKQMTASRSDGMTNVVNRIREHNNMSKWKADGQSARLPKLPKDIVYLQLIGLYPMFVVSDANRDMKKALGDNAVSTRAHRPPSRLWQGARHTLQQVLFAGYQAPRTTQVASQTYGLGIGRGKAPNAQRTTCPYVYLSLNYVNRVTGERGAHAILVDFSDPAHPAIFDPNFGYMEAEQGFCYLSFEQALHVIWEFYSGRDTTTLRQGVKHHTPPSNAFFHIAAYQIYMQSVD